MMKKQTVVQVAAVALFFLLTACGESAPVALTTVHPELDETGSMRALAEERPGQAITLYQAVLAQGVPTKVAKAAMVKYDQFKGQVKNFTHMVMIDFTQHSSRSRFYLVDQASGKVQQMAVAHGEASDPQNTGYAKYFSNVPDSHMSSLGSYLISEVYQSAKFGPALRLDGLEDTTSNVRDRAIVLHPSHYVKDGAQLQGRSLGCPAIPYSWISKVIEATQNGAFMYAYGVNQRKTVNDKALIEQWNLVPRALWHDESEEAPVEGL